MVYVLLCCLLNSAKYCSKLIYIRATKVNHGSHLQGSILELFLADGRVVLLFAVGTILLSRSPSVEQALLKPLPRLPCMKIVAQYISITKQCYICRQTNYTGNNIFKKIETLFIEKGFLYTEGYSSLL